MPISKNQRILLENPQKSSQMSLISVSFVINQKSIQNEQRISDNRKRDNKLLITNIGCQQYAKETDSSSTSTCKWLADY